MALNQGFASYVNKQQDSLGTGDPTVHPAVARYNQTMQDTHANMPAPASSSGITPNIPANPATTPTPQAQDPTAAGQLPNDTAMAGASAGGGTDSVQGGASQNAAEKPLGSIDVTGQSNLNSVLNEDVTGANGGDTIAAMANGADAAANARIAALHRQQQGSPDQYTSISNSNGPLPSVAGFSGDQLQNAQHIIDIGKARGMSRDDIQTALMTALDESQLQNLNHGDADSLGLFQQRPSQGWGNAQQVMDPSYAANKFFDALSGLVNRGQMTPWQAAQAVQRSAFADGSNYQAQFGRAQQLMGALYDRQQNQGAMVSPTMKPNGSLSWIDSHTNKYLDYDGAYGAQCVDLYAFYVTGFCGGQAPPVGYAQEIWNNFDQNALVRVDRSQTPQMGDIAIFGMGGNTPMSHVGIVTQLNSNGTLRTLSNNATSAGASGNSAIVDLSTSSLIGYLRPRKLMG